MKTLVLSSAIFAAIFSSCRGFTYDGTGEYHEGNHTVTVTKQDFGEEWPLTVDAVTIGCDGENTVIRDENTGLLYQPEIKMNKGHELKGFHDINEIKLQDKPITPLAKIGRKICK